MTLPAVHRRGSLNRGRAVVVVYYCFLESSYLEDGERERDGKATAKLILRKKILTLDVYGNGLGSCEIFSFNIRILLSEH
jgi:hypothetical protein